jgi:dynactin complex subunit
MNTLGNRLKQLCEALGESPTQFATVRLGYSSPSKLYNWISGKFYPKEDSFQLIEEKVPTLNSQWLRKGVGTMFEMNEEVGIQKPIPTLQPDSKSQERKTGPTVESLQLENTVLKEKIALLERYLERLERTHDALLGKL